jgi:hypothetical protein
MADEFYKTDPTYLDHMNSIDQEKSEMTALRAERQTVSSNIKALDKAISSISKKKKLVKKDKLKLNEFKRHLAAEKSRLNILNSKM